MNHNVTSLSVELSRTLSDCPDVVCDLRTLIFVVYNWESGLENPTDRVVKQQLSERRLLNSHASMLNQSANIFQVCCAKGRP